jgi:hypothetical protein
MKKITIFSLLLACAFALQAQTWQSRIAGFSYSVNGGQVYAISENVAWTYGVEWDGNGLTHEHTGLSRTYTAGSAWESVSFPTQEKAQLISLAAIDENHVWLLLSMDPDDSEDEFRLYKTTNGGTDWTTQDIFLPTHPALIHMWNALEGVVISDPDPDGFRIRRTLDGGVTWTPVDNLPPALFDELVTFNTSAVSGNSLWAATALGRVLTTNDRGLTWSVIESPFNEFPPYSLDVSDDGQLYMVSYDRFAVHGDTRIFRKQLPDGPWLNISEQATTYFPYNIKAIPGSPTVMFTTFDWISNKWLTRISFSEGLSWITVDSTIQATYTDFYNTEIGYASQENFTGFGSTRMYRYVGSPLLGISNQTPLRDATIAITPNPSSTTSTVDFVSNTSADYWLLIHDMQGNLLYRAEYTNATLFSEQIDISAWPAGNFALTVASDRGILTRSLTKQ